MNVKKHNLVVKCMCWLLQFRGKIFFLIIFSVIYLLIHHLLTFLNKLIFFFALSCQTKLASQIFGRRSIYLSLIWSVSYKDWRSAKITKNVNSVTKSVKIIRSFDYEYKILLNIHYGKSIKIIRFIQNYKQNNTAS